MRSNQQPRFLCCECAGLVGGAGGAGGVDCGQLPPAGFQGGLQVLVYGHQRGLSAKKRLVQPAAKSKMDRLPRQTSGRPQSGLEVLGDHQPRPKTSDIPSNLLQLPDLHKVS